MQICLSGIKVFSKVKQLLLPGSGNCDRDLLTEISGFNEYEGIFDLQADMCAIDKAGVPF